MRDSVRYSRPEKLVLQKDFYRQLPDIIHATLTLAISFWLLAISFLANG